MGNTGTDLVQMSDTDLVKQLGSFIRAERLKKNRTQAELSVMAGLNRWTVSQIEKGEPVTLMSLIQILRALDCLYVLSGFSVQEEISPLEYLKLKTKQKVRLRARKPGPEDKNEPGW